MIWCQIIVLAVKRRILFHVILRIPHLKCNADDFCLVVEPKRAGFFYVTTQSDNTIEIKAFELINRFGTLHGYIYPFFVCCLDCT